MIQIFTHNDVIRYAYKETTDEENQLIEEALSLEPAMLSYYFEVLETKIALTGAKLEPSPKSVKNILSYSANHQMSHLRRC